MAPTLFKSTCDLCGRLADSEYEASARCACKLQPLDEFKALVANKREIVKKKDKVAAAATAAAGGSGSGLQEASAAAGPSNALPPKKPKPQRQQHAPAPPAAQHHPVVKLPPIPQEPKPDPLGRNLSREKQQELPPGYTPPGMDTSEPAKGKAAKKNQKRATKRKEVDASGNSTWDGANSETMSEAGADDLDAGGLSADQYDDNDDDVIARQHAPPPAGDDEDGWQQVKAR
eukprot:gene4149-4398_t